MNLSDPEVIDAVLAGDRARLRQVIADGFRVDQDVDHDNSDREKDAFFHALRRADVETMGILLEAGCRFMSPKDYELDLPPAEAETVEAARRTAIVRSFPRHPDIFHVYRAFSDIQIVREMLADDVDLALPAHPTSSVLDLALLVGNEAVLVLLIEAGAEPKKGWSKGGVTALLRAVDKGRANVVRMILAREVDPNSRGYISPRHGVEPALNVAARTGDMAVIELLLAAGADPNGLSDAREGALHHAAQAGDKNTIELLLAAGAEQTALDRNGAGPIHRLCIGSRRGVGHRRVVSSDHWIACLEIFVAAGVPIDAADGFWRTPLMLAADAGSYSLVHRLLELGADPRARDAKGRTALGYARSSTAVVFLRRQTEAPRSVVDLLEAVEPRD